MSWTWELFRNRSVKFTKNHFPIIAHENLLEIETEIIIRGIYDKISLIYYKEINKYHTCVNKTNITLKSY